MIAYWPNMREGVTKCNGNSHLVRKTFLRRGFRLSFKLCQGREKKLQEESGEPSLKPKMEESAEKKGSQEKVNEARSKLHKESLLNFSYGLAFPDRQAETS